MSGLPQTTVVGTLTGDPEIQMLPNGSAKVKINIVCKERKYNKQTNSYEDGDPTYLRGVVWRQYGENVVESLSKGDRVIATGHIQMQQWEDKATGQKRTAYELLVDEIGPALRFNTVTVNKGEKVSASAPAGWGAAASEEPAW